MKTIEIKDWMTGAVLFAYDVEDSDTHPVRTALVAGVRAGRDPEELRDERDDLRAQLDDPDRWIAPAGRVAKIALIDVIERELAAPRPPAELNDAELNGAELNDAELNGAELNGAELNDAELNGAELNGAELNGAKLNGAELNGAKLNDAELNGAELNDAKLNDAELNGAELNGAKLNDAELNDAELNDAELNDAELNGAELNRAKLNGAKLNDAELNPIRDDIYDVLSRAPAEAPGLLAAIREGRIDGSAYEGACACLVGTLAKERGCNYADIPGLAPNSYRPAEKWFLALRPGLTPDNHQVTKITADWVSDWIAKQAEQTT